MVGNPLVLKGGRGRKNVSALWALHCDPFRDPLRWLWNPWDYFKEGISFESDELKMLSRFAACSSVFRVYLIVVFRFYLLECEACRSKQGECPVHKIPNSNRKLLIPGQKQPVKFSYAIASFPEEVQLCVSSIPGAGCGVCAKQHIPVGTWIGPYEGKHVKCDDIKPNTDTSYMWEVLYCFYRLQRCAYNWQMNWNWLTTYKTRRLSIYIYIF